MTAAKWESIRLEATLRGWRYPGEVVQAPAWQPGLGVVSPGSLFRIVLFPSPQALSPEAASDPFVAFTVQPPGRGLRETPAPYSGASACGLVFTTLPQGGVLPSPTSGTGPTELARHLLNWWELAEWDRRLPLLRLLAPGLAPAAAPDEVAAQEKVLLAAVADLQQKVTRLGPLLGEFYAIWDDPMDEAAGILERLASLGRAASSASGGPLGLCLALAAAYPSPEALEHDLSFPGRASLLEPHLPAVLSASRYLLAAGLDEGELALDRVSLMERMAPAALLADPTLWPSLQPMFTWFQGRYRAFYTDYHRSYHREVAQARAELEKALPRLQALERLNTIAELGPPVGVGLGVEYQEALAALLPCSREGLSPEAPLCPGCGLRPAARPPAVQVEDLLRRLEGALGQQQARLSSQAVRHILHSGGSRLEQFLKVLRAGDPSPLVNVLDAEVVAFLRQLLAEGQMVTVKSSALSGLRRQFPRLEEAKIKEVLAWLEKELRQDFEAARQRHPGKHTRLTW